MTHIIKSNSQQGLSSFYIMNWMFVILVAIYPLFGLSFYLIQYRLNKIKRINTVILSLTLISFVAGLGLMVYAIIYG